MKLMRRLVGGPSSVCQGVAVPADAVRFSWVALVLSAGKQGFAS